MKSPLPAPARRGFTLLESLLVGPAQLRFLKDGRVTFVPFAGAGPDELVVILVRLDPGILTDAGLLTETKGAITAPPE